MGTLMRRISLLLAIFLFSALSQEGYSQIFYNLTEADIIAELEKKGLDYEEVKTELYKNGVDITKLEIQDVTLEQRQIIERVILDLTEKKLSESEEERIRKELESELEKESMEESDEVMESDSLQIDEELIPEEEEVNTSEIYGQDLFRNDILQLTAKSDEINAPDSYILGPGDELVISVWGRSQFEKEYVIPADGYIRLLDGRDRLYLKGTTLAQAREKIKKYLKRDYSFSEGEFDIALNFSRKRYQ